MGIVYFDGLYVSVGLIVNGFWRISEYVGWDLMCGGLEWCKWISFLEWEFKWLILVGFYCFVKDWFWWRFCCFFFEWFVWWIGF